MARTLQARAAAARRQRVARAERPLVNFLTEPASYANIGQVAGHLPAALQRILQRARAEELTASWHVHRLLVDRLGVLPEFSGDSVHRILFITEREAICRAQLFPFYFYQRQILEQWSAEVREIPLRTFQQNPKAVPGEADVVCLQTWFNVSHKELLGLIATIRTHHPHARIVYMDWFAPIDLRFAEVLNDHVDVYVKKHVFRDHTRYGQATRGDTNLTDYYGSAYGIDYPRFHFNVPASFMDKLVVGPGFITADYMLGHLLSAEPPRGKRPIDVHARLGAKGAAWYTRMRQDACKALEPMKDLRMVTTAGVNRADYLQELRGSKICFSPFGYGEVCWRDYEAAMSGSLLIKPDTSHLITKPNLFINHETYVPVRWDFADLEEKIRYYLAHDDERERIARNAYAVLHDYAVKERFLEDMRPAFADLRSEPVARKVGRQRGVKPRRKRSSF